MALKGDFCDLHADQILDSEAQPLSHKLHTASSRENHHGAKLPQSGLGPSACHCGAKICPPWGKATHSGDWDVSGSPAVSQNQEVSLGGALGTSLAPPLGLEVREVARPSTERTHPLLSPWSVPFFLFPPLPMSSSLQLCNLATPS